LIGAGFPGLGLLTTLLAQGITTIFAAPIAALVMLVLSTRSALRRQGRHALEFLGAAAVWLAAGVAVVSFVLYNHTLARTRAEQVIAACRHYEADNGRLPASLEELVPRYLAVIPRAKCTAFNYAFEYSDHRTPAAVEGTSRTAEVHAGTPPSEPGDERDIAPEKARRDAVVLARARAQGLAYDGKGPIHSLRYSTDGPFARWVYFFEQDRWILLK
jgi:hypothetical protein